MTQESAKSRSLWTLLTLAISAVLGGCAGPRVADYAAETPKLDIRSYFNGPITAHGIVTNRSGQVVRRFLVQMNCSWQGDEGTLEELFHYSDGKTQTRVWRMHHLADGSFSATAGDVIGSARGEQAGNAYNMQYTLALEVDGRTWELQFDDWMYQLDEHTIINRAVMSKFGVRLGEVIVSFAKAGA